MIQSQSDKIQGIPAFRDFTIRDPRYFVILFQWKLAEKVDFRKFLKVRFLKTVQIKKIVRFLKLYLQKIFKIHFFS